VLYIGGNVMNQIVGRVREEIIAEGKAWVSTGDILLTWFPKVNLYPSSSCRCKLNPAFKAAYLGEGMTGNPSLERSTVVSILTALQDPDVLGHSHNALITPSLPTAIPVNKLADMRLADLTLTHRKCVTENYTLSYIHACDQWIRSVGGIVFPLRSTSSWSFSNQSIGRLDSTDLGSGKTYMSWNYTKPVAVDHMIFVNRFQDGYILDVGIRRSRWEVVVAEMKRMNEGIPSKVA
jgi:hypothetical protein